MQNKKVRLLLQIVCLAAAGAFVYIGFSRGEVRMVFSKAVRICMECIGLG